MIYQLYAINDRKSEYWSPRIFQNERVAVRDFANMVNFGESDNVIHNYPDDFSLYHLGSYDSAEGVISPLKKPKFIIDASAVKGVTIHEG